MDYGKYLVHDTGVIVFVGTDEEYGVATMEEDPQSRYSPMDVMKYVRENPHMAITEDEYYAPTRRRAEIRGLKEYLSNTDWCVIKCLEMGVNMADKYPDISRERTKARTRINELEGELGGI